MARFVPLVKRGFYANRMLVPLVKGNGDGNDGPPPPDPVWDTISGNPVSFEAYEEPWPLKQLEVAFSPVQSGSGDPSPDNVRPISGWDGVTVWRTGKNLFDAEHPEKNGYYYVDGTYNSVSGYSCYLVPAKAEQKYTCQGNFAGIKTFWDKDLNFISGINQGGGAVKTFTTPEGTAYFRISIQETSIDGTQQIEFGETASDVVPYNGTSISISFGSTVYSGTLDVLTGVVTVDMAVQDLSAVTWTYQGGDSNRAYAQISGVKNGGSGWNKINILCDTYAIGSIGSGTTADNVIGINGVTCYLRDNRFSSTDEYRNGVTGYLVYELADPITIQLTPEQVNSLAGSNVMWSNLNGDLEITYRSA